MPRSNGQKQAYWRSILRRQEQSGLSARKFCSGHQLSEASFYYWKRKIANLARDRQVGTPRETGGGPSAPVKKAARPKENTAVFIPVRVNAAANSELNSVAGSGLEVVHPRGHVVRVPTVFDENALRQVLRILDRQGDT